MQFAHAGTPARKKSKWWQSDALKWLVVGLFSLVTCYLIVLMYAQGEYLFAILTLITVSAGLYVFANRRAYARRYVYPGVAGMALFVLFPLICTIAIAFTNYSSTNQLTFERAQSVLMQRQFQSGKTFTFGLYPAENQQWRLQLTPPDSEQALISEPFRLDAAAPQTLKLTAQSAAPQGERATLRAITQNRQALSQLVAQLPDGGELRMSSLRQFSGTRPLYALDKDGSTLTNNQTSALPAERRHRLLSGDQRRRRLGAGNPEPGLYRHHRLEKLPAGAAGRGHQETVRVDLHLDHRVLGDDGDPHRGGRHGVGLRGAVGSAERQGDLPRAADPALCGAVIHLDPDLQRFVQPELRRDQHDAQPSVRH